MNPTVVPSEKPTAPGRADHFAGQDLYRLLELPPFESNPSVISSKVRELMRETRKYQLGIHAARTQSRMEEIAAATACLLDPRQKQVYDEELRRHYGMPPVSVASTYAGPIPESHPTDSASKTVARGPSRWQRTTLVLVVIAVVALIAWGFRVLAPAPTDRATPMSKPARPGPAVGTSSPTATVGAQRAAAAASKHPIRPTDRKSPDTARGTVAVKDTVPAKETSAIADDLPTDFDIDPLITAIQGIVADGFGPAVTDKASTDSSGTQPPRQGPADNFPSVIDPADGRRTPPATVSSGATGRRPAAVTSSAKQNRAADHGLPLTPHEVLRELRDVRLKRTPALRLANVPRSIGAERVVELVRYARTAFDDDRRFQRQLDQEVVALKRVYPQLRDLLPDPAR